MYFNLTRLPVHEGSQRRGSLSELSDRSPGHPETQRVRESRRREARTRKKRQPATYSQYGQRHRALSIPHSVLRGIQIAGDGRAG